MSIDWYQIRAQDFSDDDIAAGLAKVAALAPGKKQIPTLWPVADPMPDLSQLDFKNVAKTKLPIAGLQASNGNLRRDNLIWHVNNPNTAKNPSPFTKRPLVMAMPDGSQVIIDGQHRLGALSLLGASKASVYLIPSK